MKDLITTIRTDGAMPSEAFDADEFVGIGILTFVDGEESVGVAEISLPDRKMRFTPNEAMPLLAPNSSLSLFGKKGITLNLKMSQPALDIHFRFEGAWVYKSYSPGMFGIEPFEFTFNRAVYGPCAPSDTFDSAFFNFADSNNLIGGERFKFSKAGMDTASFERPADMHADGYSKKLAMKINLHSRPSFGFGNIRKPRFDLNRQSYAIAQFDEPIQVVDLLNRVHTFITFASILRGASTNVTHMSLRCGDGHSFALRQSWTNPVIEDNDEGEFSDNWGVLSASIGHFERFSEFHDVNDAFDTLATVSPLGDNMGWSFVALISTAEGLVKMFESKRRSRKPLWARLKHIATVVEPYFAEVPGDDFLKKVAKHRDAQMHKAMSPFRLTETEVVIARNTILRTMLRAYVLHKCELPRRAILKALNGPRPSGDFYDLRPKRD